LQSDARGPPDPIRLDSAALRPRAAPAIRSRPTDSPPRPKGVAVDRGGPQRLDPRRDHASSLRPAPLFGERRVRRAELTLRSSLPHRLASSAEPALSAEILL